MGFPCGSASKESTCNAGDLGLIPGLGRSPGEEKGYPLQYSDLENSMECIYSPWGPKQLDTTERPSLHFTLWSVLRITFYEPPAPSQAPHPALTCTSEPSFLHPWVLSSEPQHCFHANLGAACWPHAGCAPGWLWLEGFPGQDPAILAIRELLTTIIYIFAYGFLLGFDS